MARDRYLSVAALSLALAFALVSPTAGAAPSSDRAGTVTAAKKLPKRLWIPDVTKKGFRLTYRTTNSMDEPGLSTGELFIPRGKAPKGGWPVISWAHGTSGLGDTCAPSVSGPGNPERDFNFLGNLMREGYAIVASDYAGLGTPGLPGYLHGRSEAHNVADMVKAGRRYGAKNLGAREQLSNRWAAVGQSQGGGAAIYTARYATEYGGPGLRYVGAAGTGVPAYIEDLVQVGGPGVPPAPLPPGVTAYLTYILASLRDTHPELGIDGILTDYGKRYVALAETECLSEFSEQLGGVIIGLYFSAPLATLPNFKPTLDDYMKMPESGFDKPFFMGHGANDTDVPYATTARYAGALEANGEPVTFKTYANDHSGTLTESQADSLPFLADLFALAGPGTTKRGVKSSVRLARGTTLGRALKRGIRVRVRAPALKRVRIVVKSGGKRVGMAKVTTSAAARASARVRFTRAFRRKRAGASAVRFRLCAAGASRKVRLRR